MDDICRDVIFIGALPALCKLELRSNYHVSASYAVIESSTEDVRAHISTLDIEPFSVRSIKKLIFTYSKWNILLFVSLNCLLADLFSREYYILTKSSSALVWIGQNILRGRRKSFFSQTIPCQRYQPTKTVNKILYSQH
jgi:hypothetical protein